MPPAGVRPVILPAMLASDDGVRFLGTDMRLDPRRARAWACAFSPPWDLRIEPSATAEACHLVEADTLVMECTFGPRPADTMRGPVR